METFCGYDVISSECYPVTGRVFYRKLDVGGFDVEVYDREDRYVVIYDLGRCCSNEEVAMDHIAYRLFAIELRLMVIGSAIPVNSSEVFYEDESDRYWFLSSDRGFRYVWDSDDKWFRVAPRVGLGGKLKGPSKNLEEWAHQALKELLKVYRKASEKSYSVEFDKVGLVIGSNLITFNNLGELEEFLDNIK
jgi:hypothetical protein